LNFLGWPRFIGRKCCQYSDRAAQLLPSTPFESAITADDFLSKAPPTL
jgi:hypothetical protein